MPVPVVVIHRNRSERLTATLSALRDQTVDVQVVLVDSGSTTAEAAAAQAMLPRGAWVVVMGGNGGFGPSANAGFRAVLAARSQDPTLAEWVFVCPHDALPAPDAIERMLAAARRQARPGLVCGDFGDGARPVIDPYFGGIQLAARRAEHGWESVDYPHGTLFAAHVDCLEHIGLLDEQYFAYGEEVEIGHRARRAGWEVGLVRGARVDNPEMSNGAAVVDYLMLRNTIHLVRRLSGRYHALIRTILALGHIVRDPSAWLVYDRRARLWALADVARGRMGPPPARLVSGSRSRGATPAR